MSGIPFLLHNGETWLAIRKNTPRDLEKLQLKQLRVSLAISKGCPKAMLY